MRNESVCSNLFTSDISFHTKLGPPKFVQKDDETIYVYAGRKFALDCFLKYKIPFEIKWFRNRKQIKHKNQTFLIDHATYEDNNTIYECQIKNMFGGPVKKEFVVMIRDYPLFVNIFYDSNLNMYSIGISCSAFGKQKPNFVLEKDGHTLHGFNETTEFIKELNQTLFRVNHFYGMVSSVNATGLYTCKISDTLKVETFHADIIEAIPPKPQIVSHEFFRFLEKYEFNILFTGILPISKNRQVRYINRIKEVKIEMKEVQYNAFGEEINSSKVIEFTLPYEQRKAYTYEEDNHPLNLFDLKLKYNIIYKIRITVRSDRGWSEFSDWYTLPSMFLCGTDVPEIFNGVSLLSFKLREKNLKYFWAREKFKCASLLTSNNYNGVCAQFNYRTCMKNITFYDGVNENAPVIAKNCIGDDHFRDMEICSSTKNIFVTFEDYGSFDAAEFNIKFCPKKNKKVYSPFDKVLASETYC
ncbi:hypothetical protein B4U79_17251 [Dinothrombium tinctorium]|uniref:Ig-like domain-containing protein n=1 Tax=Dinothrombium tinctorium TaxID=1965070 RepID=A0A3S3SQX3_9ACAR|nr:hypothetical protein B4U79_17251 [Dinothrombium tinctorium]